MKKIGNWLNFTMSLNFLFINSSSLGKQKLTHFNYYVWAIGITVWYKHIALSATGLEHCLL